MKLFTISVLAILFVSGCEGAARGIAYIGESNTQQTNQIGGIVQFDQATSGDDVIVTGSVTGLAPNSIHGFHVHTFGDSRDKATTFSTHFNVDAAMHGAPPSTSRHNGDMGNITADASGVATISITIGQDKMNLFPGSTKSIIGRAVIVHPTFDGGFLAQPSGNAGTPFAFGKIGVANLASNEAGPSTGAAYAISNHVGLGDIFAGGSIWIQVTGGNITVYTNFSGFIPKANYQLGFYEFGDQLLTSRNSGPLITEVGRIKVTNSGSTCHNLTIASIDDLVGRMSILFDSEGVAYDNIISMGVVSLASGTIKPFVSATDDYVCTGPAGAWTSGASHVSFGVGIVVALAAVVAMLA